MNKEQKSTKQKRLEFTAHDLYLIDLSDYSSTNFVYKSNFIAFIKFCYNEYYKEIEKLKNNNKSDNYDENYDEKENCLCYHFYMGFNEELKTIVTMDVKISLTLVKDEEKGYYYYLVFVKTNINDVMTSIIRIYDYDDDEAFKKKLKSWVDSDFRKGSYSKDRNRIIATFEMIADYDNPKSFPLKYQDIDESILRFNAKENPFRYYKPPYYFGNRIKTYSTNDNIMKKSLIGNYLRSSIQIIESAELISCPLEDKQKINSYFNRIYDLPKEYKLKCYRFRDGEFYTDPPFNYIIYIFEFYRNTDVKKDRWLPRHYIITYNSYLDMFEYLANVDDPGSFDVNQIVEITEYGFV